MKFVCDCVDTYYHPRPLYQSVPDDEWLCIVCLVAYGQHKLPSLVDQLGIDIRDLFAPENQEDSE